ncbi:alpha/beta hydrolase family protein [Alkalicoccus urumqiensis]|uniref:alpha/beta hydrolase family protein n=1 Tax=Alkalicoccus urumqiensis TaxID=1548213 RepID=UPI0015E5D934|nr:hypothetical protein [Alkalicoccus urumqiensis]
MFHSDSSVIGSRLETHKRDRWWKRRVKRTAENDRGLAGMTLGMFAASTAACIIAASATPTGLGLFLDLLLYISAHTAAFALVTAVVSVLLSFMYIPLPRVVFSASLFAAGLAYYIQEEASLGGTFIVYSTGAFMISAYMLGIVFQVWMGHRPPVKKLLFSAVPILWFAALFLYHPEIPQFQAPSTFEGNDYIQPLSMEDPGEPGEYAVETLHYGSGEDLHRPHFGDETDITSPSVDASLWFEEGEWEPWRTRFWGYDETSFPLNGSMWMPEGDGPFPVVLIAHGNHRMEHFSDDGYAYLGEHLASRGYAVVSLDQNMVNYSNWTGSPDENMRLRAWLFMQHLLQLHKWADGEENTVFAEKLDMQRVSLIGHSRGGQAIAMVTDRDRFFENDPSLAGMEEIGIEALIALAPTDQQVDDQRAVPRNVDFLTLHGARDGDVNNFRGERLYTRTSWDDSRRYIKSAVYMADANHSQFNTSWGRKDVRLPGALFLTTRQMMAAEEQRKAANVYITSFLEASLRDSAVHETLFRDARYGAEWLPETQYITRYENSSYTSILDFSREREPDEFSEPVEVSAEGFTEWESGSAVDRSDNRKAPDGLLFEWDSSSEFRVGLDEAYAEELAESDPDYFVLSIAQRDKEVPGETDPELTILYTFESGAVIEQPVEQFYDIAASVWTQYTRFPFLEEDFRDGKYEEAVEPVSAAYLLPLDQLEEGEGTALENLESIAVAFEQNGRIMIDQFGFMQE